MLLKQKLKTWQKRAHIRREERERGVSDLSYVIYLKGKKLVMMYSGNSKNIQRRSGNAYRQS